MALSASTVQREHDKFKEVGNETSIKAVILDSSGNQIQDFGARFGTNDIDEASATLTYVGMEDDEGTWVIQKIDESSGTSLTYATNKNNPSVTSYVDAWANRTSLTYGSYSEAF